MNTIEHLSTTDMLYTPDQVAELLQVTRRTIYVWIRKEKLAAVKAGSRVRIHSDAVAAFLKMK
jgi:excisionase family DNA binding protein